MSSRAGSTILTFLMSIPVAAVGLMAVFGVPPLSSVIAASRAIHDDLGFDNDRSDRRSGRGGQDTDEESAPDWATDDSGTNELADLGDESDLGKSDRTDSKSRSDRNPKTAMNDEAESSFENSDDEAIRFGDEKPDSRKRGRPEKSAASSFAYESDAGSRRAATKVSMKESLKKLNSLNVKKYHLVPGADPDTWLFVCLFSPGDDQRVIHRFESEDPDPDLAVAKTVEQIDAWLLKRFKDNTSLSQMAH